MLDKRPVYKLSSHLLASWQCLRCAVYEGGESCACRRSVYTVFFRQQGGRGSSASAVSFESARVSIYRVAPGKV